MKTFAFIERLFIAGNLLMHLAGCTSATMPASVPTGSDLQPTVPMLAASASPQDSAQNDSIYRHLAEPASANAESPRLIEATLSTQSKLYFPSLPFKSSVTEEDIKQIAGNMTVRKDPPSRYANGESTWEVYHLNNPLPPTRNPREPARRTRPDDAYIEIKELPTPAEAQRELRMHVRMVQIPPSRVNQPFGDVAYVAASNASWLIFQRNGFVVVIRTWPDGTLLANLAENLDAVLIAKHAQKLDENKKLDDDFARSKSLPLP